MTDDFLPRKAALRERMRTELRALQPADRAVASHKLIELLKRQPAWLQAHSLLGFAPRADEPDMLPLLDAAQTAGKTVCLPRHQPHSDTYIAAVIRDWRHDLQPGRFGLLEPQGHCAAFPLNQLDLALVPGLAFDLDGRRLGRGKGYFDRLLAEVPGAKCGVAFDFQVVPAVPVEPHDVRLTCLLTPSRWHWFAAGARF